MNTLNKIEMEAYKKNESVLSEAVRIIAYNKSLAELPELTTPIAEIKRINKHFYSLFTEAVGNTQAVDFAADFMRAHYQGDAIELARLFAKMVMVEEISQAENTIENEEYDDEENDFDAIQEAKSESYVMQRGF